jgi:hypothetical protein
MPETKSALRSKIMREKQDHDDDQQDSDEPVAPMTVSVARTTEAPAEAAEQEDHEYDEEYETK